MKTSLAFVAIVSALGLVQPLFGRAAFAAAQLDQSNLGPVTAGTAISSEFAAQVITVGKPGNLDSIDLAIRKFDGFTFGDLTVEIRGVTAGEPNATVLGSKTFANTSISPADQDFTSFDLSSLNLAFGIGDQFAMVVFSANHSGSLFPIALTDDAYPGGGFFSSLDGATWFAFTRFVRFRTFVEDPVTTVGLDIKPGSDPNCFNVNGHGVIPVAILGSLDFDPSQVDSASLNFAGFEVRMRGNKGPLCSVEDVNFDGIDDLVCQFEDDGSAMWDPNDSATATLTGVTTSGTQIAGEDSICVKPN